MSVNETDSIRNIEVMIDELHVKQNILQSDIDIVVNNLCDLFIFKIKLNNLQYIGIII
jgi:hypothetical protein